MYGIHCMHICKTQFWIFTRHIVTAIQWCNSEKTNYCCSFSLFQLFDKNPWASFTPIPVLLLPTLFWYLFGPFHFFGTIFRNVCPRQELSNSMMRFYWSAPTAHLLAPTGALYVIHVHCAGNFVLQILRFIPKHRFSFSPMPMPMPMPTATQCNYFHGTHVQIYPCQSLIAYGTYILLGYVNITGSG